MYKLAGPGIPCGPCGPVNPCIAKKFQLTVSTFGLGKTAGTIGAGMFVNAT